MKLRPQLARAAWLAILVLPVTAPVFALGPTSKSSGATTAAPRQGDGYLGVDFENLTNSQRTSLQAPAEEGVAIAAVDHDAPAGKAGLRSNDVIVQLDGKKVHDAGSLRAALHTMHPGQRVDLVCLRNGQPIQFSIVLADRKTIGQQAWAQHYTVPDPKEPTGFFGAVPSEISKTFSANGGLMRYIPGTLPYTGITFDVMNPQLAQYFGLKNSTGLLVKSIDANSPGLRAGLQAGDVICKANDELMISRSRWGHVLKENRHEAIKLQILRDRHARILVLTLAAGKF